jgi:putative pyoverdin transport system ATP-binding/permease protein
MKVLLFLLRCSKHIRYSRSIIILVIVAGLLGGLSSTALLAIVSSVITRPTSVTSTLVWAFVGISLVGAVTRIASQLLLLRFSTRAVFELRMQLCRRMLAVPLRHLEESGAHRLLASLTDDIPQIIGALSNIPALCTQAAIVVCTTAYLVWLSWKVFLTLLGLILLGAALYRLSIRKGYKYMELTREEWAKLLKHLRGLIDGTKELKLHAERRESFLTQGLQATSEKFRRYRILTSTIFVAADFWNQLIYSLMLGLLLFVLPHMRGLDAHVLTGYTLAFFYMMGPLQGVISFFPTLGQATVAVNNVERLGISLASNPVEVDAVTQAGTPVAWNRIELAGVSHSYLRERENTSFTLGPLELNFYPGELVFVTGGNGSGKTTLVKLLTGLYVPEAGEIRLDGEPVTHENRDQYRQHFSVVFSDFFLFESFFGLDTPELDAQAHEYLTQLQLNHKVEVKDGVLSTTNLSQGQRKRLALLTAYLENRSIYVFDEWAADQDPQFKEIFYYELLPNLKARGKTVIVISHDDHYYHVADRIIRLDYGNVESDAVLHTTEPAAAVALTVPAT